MDLQFWVEASPCRTSWYMKLSVYFCFFSVSVQSQWLIKGKSPTSLVLLELKSKHSNMSETFFISHCQGMVCSTVIHSMQNFIPLSSHLWEMLINSERFFPPSLSSGCVQENLAEMSASTFQHWQLNTQNFLLVSCWSLLQGDTQGTAQDFDSTWRPSSPPLFLNSLF